MIPASFRYSREVRRPSFTVSCLQFESWKAFGFHSSCYTKFAAISQRIALYFEAFREILQRYKRGRHPHDDALLFSRQARSSHPLFKFENWKALGFHSPYYTKLVVTSQRIGLRIIPEKNWYAVKLYLWKDGARQLTNSPVPRLFFFLFFFRIVPFIQNRFHLCN